MVTVCPACMAGGGRGVPGLRRGGIQIVRTLAGSCLPVASMPLPFLALAYYALTLAYRNCLACGACHVHGPVHMAHIGERHRRQTKEKAVTLRE